MKFVAKLLPSLGVWMDDRGRSVDREKNRSIERSEFVKAVVDHDGDRVHDGRGRRHPEQDVGSDQRPWRLECAAVTQQWPWIRFLAAGRVVACNTEK
jgi:hypothetical protein